MFSGRQERPDGLRAFTVRDGKQHSPVPVKKSEVKEDAERSENGAAGDGAQL